MKMRLTPGMGALVGLFGLCFLAAFYLIGPSCAISSHPLSTIATAQEETVEAVPGELIVKFRESTGPSMRMAALQVAGAQEIERIDELGVSLVAIAPDTSPIEEAERYREMPEVEFAEPNYIFRADMTPSDPFYLGRQQWYYNLIGAPAAWDSQTGSASTVVAVLDTGIDKTHPDLKDSLWRNPGETPGNGVDDDGNGCIDDVNGCNFVGNVPSCPNIGNAPNNRPEDDEGHGTFVSGIIAAKANNNIGVAGVAPGVKIMPVKVLDCQGAGTALAAMQGLLYAARSGAKVVNISFGSDMESAILSNAIDQAYDQYGVTIVASAGNSSKGLVAFPARHPKVIGVSASDHRQPDAKASFSNWGTGVTVTAPGVDIASTVPANLCGIEWFCFGSKPYAVAKGTSFSSAIVSGAAALIVSSQPDITPAAVRDRLRFTAKNLPDETYSDWDGAGLIQIDQALVWQAYRIGLSGVTRN